MYRCYPPDFVFNVYSSYIENEWKRKRWEDTTMRSVSPDFVSVRTLRVISHKRNEESNGRRFRFMVDGRWISRQIARKPRRAPPSWNMTALIQGSPSPTLDTTANFVRRFQLPPIPSLVLHPQTYLPDVLRLCRLSFLTTPARSCSPPTIIRVVALRYTSLSRNCKARGGKMRHTKDRGVSIRRREGRIADEE